MVVVVFVVTLLLIFPFVFSFYGYYSVFEKRLYFAIYFFAKLKVISGYIKLRNKGGVYIHLSEEKAIIIDFNTLKKLKGGPDFLSDFQFSSIYFIVDSGIKNTNLLFVTLSVVFGVKKFAKVLYENGKLPNIVVDFNLYEENTAIKSIKFKINGAFNIICILQSIIANYKSVGAKYVKRKKAKFKRVYS